MSGFNLKRKILLPLVFSGLAIISLGLYFVVQLENRQIKDATLQQAQSLQNHIQSVLNAKAEAMAAILSFIVRDSQLMEALKSKDRSTLLTLSESIYKRLNQSNQITHFYFHDVDRINLLRVHQPDRYGDVINRFTLLAAEKSHLPSFGIELGPLGTFTLRYVLPVQENNHLIGYLELGQEIDNIIQQTHEIFGVEILTLIKKQYLDRTAWETGMKMLSRTFNWDALPATVLVSANKMDLPVDLLSNATDEHTGSDVVHIEHQLQINQREYWVAVIPLLDAGDRHVAFLVMLSDQTAMVSKSKTDFLLFIAILSVISLGIFVLFFMILGRAEKALATARQDLINEHQSKTELQAGFILKLQHEQMKLGESEERTRLLLDAVGEGIYGLDLQGAVTFVNPAACQMLGYQANELIGHSIHSLVHHSYATGQPYPAENCQICAALLDSNLHHVSDEVFWCKDGSSFPVDYISTPVLKAGKLAGAVVVFSDITLRKQAQMKIELALHIQRVMDTILNISLPPLTLQDVLTKSLDAVLTIPAFSLLNKGSVFLLADGGNTLEMVAQRNLPDFLLQACSHIPLGHCLCGKAAAQREIIFTNHLDESHEIRYDGIKPHGHYCVPIQSEGKLLGVLNIYVAHSHSYDEEEKAYLKTVSDTMGVVIVRKQAEEALVKLAHHDILTGLPNRTLFHDRLEQMIALMQRRKIGFFLFFMDLDHFKDINDNFGHDAGDMVLKEAARRLQGCVERKSDTVCRMGGDEFTVILSEVEIPEQAGLVAERIIQALSQPFDLNGEVYHLSCSLGIAQYPEHGEDGETLIKHADEAMYQAKKQRNTYRFFGDNSQPATQ